nr:AAA family ATPase [Lachnospiraceae bacterium]
MARLGIPVGISDFEKIRKNGYYYVDKSGLIAELLEEKSTEVTLITRPRRFGKTLGMSMLANFFDIRKESTELFKGLEIAEQRDVCSEWMNQFPTLFVTFKDVDGLDFSSAYGMLSSTITELYKGHLYLMESSRISPYDKEIMQRIITEEATVTDIKK